MTVYTEHGHTVLVERNNGGNVKAHQQDRKTLKMIATISKMTWEPNHYVCDAVSTKSYSELGSLTGLSFGKHLCERQGRHGRSNNTTCGASEEQTPTPKFQNHYGYDIWHYAMTYAIMAMTSYFMCLSRKVMITYIPLISSNLWLNEWHMTS